MRGVPGSDGTPGSCPGLSGGLTPQGCPKLSTHGDTLLCPWRPHQGQTQGGTVPPSQQETWSLEAFWRARALTSPEVKSSAPFSSVNRAQWAAGHVTPPPSHTQQKRGRHPSPAGVRPGKLYDRLFH